MDWLLERLNEPSTWRGLIGLLTCSGIVISPDLSSSIVTLGLSAIAVIEIIRKERAK